MVTTLVLTRKPNYPFQSTEFPTQHGRFGTLIVLSGSKVKAVQVVPGAGAPSGAISVPDGVLDPTTVDGGDVREIKRYTTIERMDNMIQLAPQEHIGTNNSHTYKGELYRVGPFGLSFEPNNSAVLHLKTALKSNPRLYAKANGNCFRVQGGLRAKGAGNSHSRGAARWLADWLYRTAEVERYEHKFYGDLLRCYA
jgi:hypothetical protein